MRYMRPCPALPESVIECPDNEQRCFHFATCSPLCFRSSPFFRRVPFISLVEPILRLHPMMRLSALPNASQTFHGDAICGNPVDQYHLASPRRRHVRHQKTIRSCAAANLLQIFQRLPPSHPTGVINAAVTGRAMKSSITTANPIHTFLRSSVMNIIAEIPSGTVIRTRRDFCSCRSWPFLRHNHRPFVVPNLM